MENKMIAAGELIFRENTPGSEMYFIQSGRVNIFKTINSEKVQLGELTKGDFMGEMTLFLNEPRQASAEALEETELMVVDKARLLNEIQTNPQFAYGMILVLMKRLKSSEAIITKLEGIKKSFEIRYGK